VELCFFTHSDGRARFSPPAPWRADDVTARRGFYHHHYYYCYFRLLGEYDVDGIFINDGAYEDTPQCSNTRIKKKNKQCTYTYNTCALALTNTHTHTHTHPHTLMCHANQSRYRRFAAVRCVYTDVGLRIRNRTWGTLSNADLFGSGEGRVMSGSGWKKSNDFTRENTKGRGGLIKK